jgi:glycosyltransferase involved in cell wall biosynthesis
MSKPALGVFPKYTSRGASSRLRIYDIFERMGYVSASFQPLFDDNYLDRLYSRRERSVARTTVAYARRAFSMLRSASCAVRVVEKELFPRIPWTFERSFWGGRVPTIVDYDDAIFAAYASSRHLEGKIAAVMKSADAVVCGNGTLGEYAARFNGDVTVIPTVLDVSVYEDVTQKAMSDSPKTLRVGWIGTPMTQKYLERVFPALDRCARQIDVSLVVMGGSPDAGFLRRPYVKFVQWSRTAERDLGSLFDVGIMPLDDDEWERGKCGYKLIQYGACGLASIASPVGVNVKIVRNGHNGLLARSESDWYEAFMRMSSHPELRLEWGKCARANVERNFDIGVSVQEWERVLSRVGARHEMQGLQG